MCISTRRVPTPRMLQAMYASVNSFICTSLRQSAGCFHDICHKAAATAVSAPQPPSTPPPASTPAPHLDGASSVPDESQHLKAFSHSPHRDRGSEAGVVAEQLQLGKSHKDSSASQAARAADEAEDPEEAPYEPPRWLAGREKLTNKERRDAELQELSPMASPDGLAAADVRHALSSALGFRLDVSKSGIEHADAGDGVWLRGSAELGTVVAIHPGVVYSQAYHTCALATCPIVTC